MDFSDRMLRSSDRPLLDVCRLIAPVTVGDGAVTGAGGIVLGLADFPLWLTLKLKLLYEIAALYGHNVKDYKERNHVAAPPVIIKSTVGAGDSMVAGILATISKGWSWKKVLQYGVASGTAATINSGTALCSIEDVEKIYSSMQ